MAFVGSRNRILRANFGLV